MVEIKEFQGLIYNKEKLNKLKVEFKNIICPPYDIISPNEHRSLLFKKYNFVNLELPKGSKTKKYQNAKKTFSSWKRSKIIIEESLPSIYIYQHKFSYPVNSQKYYTRYGIFCLVKADPEYKEIFPHEQINPKPIEERMRLVETLGIETSSPFLLVEDPEKKFLNMILKLLKPYSLFLEVKQDDGQEHKVYRISDPQSIKNIKNFFKSKNLYIADGHHRYRVYCDYLKKNKKEYFMAYISSLEDDGLLILPTHRAVAGGHIYEEIKRYFDIVDWDGRSNLEIVLYHNGVFKTLKPKFYFDNLPKIVLKNPYFLLDKVLSELEGEDIRQHLFYHQDMKEVISYADKYNGCAFIMPSIKKEDFVKIVKNKIIFPPKTTYFYPKVYCGFVFYKL
ncbi:MAG: DUF1015 domain-containing protein [Endomicrobia bacterium]|nr:DUF1015 domain-containing protein [Endomicrobiia bacterium]